MSTGTRSEQQAGAERAGPGALVPEAPVQRPPRARGSGEGRGLEAARPTAPPGGWLSTWDSTHVLVAFLQWVLFQGKPILWVEGKGYSSKVRKRILVEMIKPFCKQGKSSVCYLLRPDSCALIYCVTTKQPLNLSALKFFKTWNGSSVPGE